MISFMISITKLLTSSKHYGDKLRYKHNSSQQKDGAMQGRGPVVVWNTTKACNLDCIHCYAEATNQPDNNELSTKEAKKFIDQLADFKVPVLLFSGGEPLMRQDLFELIEYTAQQGIRPVISTNGTLIDQTTAQKIKDSGVKYVGISLDGIGHKNDKFRGRKGAYQKALQGIKNCLQIKQKVGLRFTISKYTFGELEKIFDLIENEKIPRVCFYHLVYSGRGNSLTDEDITDQQKRQALDLIMAKTKEFKQKEMNVEILTVDNHADGIYTYLQQKKSNPQQAEKILQLLKNNGGNRSGIAFGCVDHAGNVYPDQFTRNITLGNIRQKDFGDIWTDRSHPIMNGLKNRQAMLTGRCTKCSWLDVCNGNLRARAQAIHDDFWASDPACYLTDQEIGLETELKTED